MSEQQDVLGRIRHGFRLFCRAEQAEGRRQLEEVWEELQPDGDPFARCMAAHYLADIQLDAQAELEWDLKALEIAQSVPEGEIDEDAPPSAIAVFLPSLHLNLADDYRRLGDFPSARRHIKEGSARIALLGFDQYGQRVRAELLRASAQIDDGDSGPPIVFDFD